MYLSLSTASLAISKTLRNFRSWLSCSARTNRLEDIEGFWTDATPLPQGIMHAKLTPKQALEAGLQVDVEAIEPAMREALAQELKTDMFRRTRRS